MDKIQISKVNMFIAMGLFFVKFSTVFTGFTQLIAEITGFSTSNDNLQGNISKQSLDISGVAVDKNKLLIAAIHLTVKAARKARVWAVNTGDETLAVKFDVHVTTFDDMTQSVVINALTTINELIKTNITSLTGYKVVAADVTAITAAIAAAAATIGTPKQAHVTKAVATAQIVTDIDTCDGYLALIDDLLVSEYEDTNVEMVKEYRLSRELQSLGNHPTGLYATSKDAETNAFLQGVEVTIVEVKRSAISNISGVVEIEHMRPGKYHVTFVKTGYVTYTVIIDFLLGKMQSVGVLMETV